VGPREGLDVEENLAPTGIRSPDRPPSSKSLYRLNYPGQQLTHECTKPGRQVSMASRFCSTVYDVGGS